MVFIPHEDDDIQKTSKNNIIVPVHGKSVDDRRPHDDNLPPYSENVEFTGEALIQELKKHIDDLARLVGRFGPKMAAVLRRSWVRAMIIQDHTKLNMLCLGNLDSFSNTQTLRFEKRTMLLGSEPLLYWLYAVTLEFITPSASSRGVHLNLTPTKVSSDQSGPIPPQMDIELKSGNKGPYIELTLYREGPFNKREVLSAPIEEIRLQTRMKYGKPVAGTSDAMDVDSMPVEESLTAVFDYLMPRQDSKWRIAMEDFRRDNDDEEFLTALAEACKASDDGGGYFVSDEQNLQCRNLFDRFPPIAKNFLKDQVGKPGGNYSARTLAPCEKD